MSRRPRTWVEGLNPTRPSPFGGVALLAGVVGLLTLLTLPLVGGEVLLSTILVDFVSVGVAVWVLRRWAPWKAPAPRIRLLPSLVMAALFLLMWFSGQVAGVWLMNNMPDASYDAYSSNFNELSLACFTLLALVAAPMSEEYIFRGVLLRSLSFSMRPFWAVVVQALAFALMHGTLTHIIPTFLVGLYLGLLAYKTAEVWPGILAHCLNNLLATLAVGPLSEAIPWVFEDGAIWIALCVISVSVMLIVVSDMDASGLHLTLPSPVRRGDVSRFLVKSESPEDVEEDGPNTDPAGSFDPWPV